MSKTVTYVLALALLAALAHPARAELSNDSNLIIYFSYDAFDQIVIDELGRGHDGLVEGNVTLDPEGLYKGAARFADGGYLDLNGPEVPDEDIPKTAVTIAAWAKCENNGGDHAIFNARASDGTWLVHPELRSSGNFRWLLRTDGGTTIFDIRAGSVDWDEWLHYAGTYDKDQRVAKLHINGQVVGQESISSPPNIARDWGMGARVGRNIDNARPFTGLMDDFCIFTRALTELEVQSLMAGLQKRGPALDPIPADEATDVPRDVVLSWTPGQYAQTHDVYFGTVFDDVNDASRTDPRQVLISQGQADPAYAFDSRLQYDQTYYWRIDEVNAAPDTTIHRGTVWSFTTEPLAYPIENIVATSNLASPAGQGPENTVNGSGLNSDDQHSTDTLAMWAVSRAGDEPVQIQFEFDRLYKLHEMYVWNHNFDFETMLGLGARDVTVEYSADGQAWSVLGDYELAQAPGTSTYVFNTTIAFAGVAARHVRVTIQSNWGTSSQVGLSEVRFMHIPVHARQPQPADGAVDVALDATLRWRSGRDAATHEVYLGTDPDALLQIGTMPQPSYAPDLLDLNKQYYWRVDEVNQAEATTVWPGGVWSFTTQEFLVVDDFEAYTDDLNAGEAIWQSWIDGWDDPANGSQVGYAATPFAEQDIVRSGRQSMPLSYDNPTAASISQAQRTFTPAQDWTANGAAYLVIWFYGAENNAGQLYCRINGTEIPYTGSATDISTTQWLPWTIDLSTAGAGTQSVASLTIGVKGAGSGVVYIDDIRLHATAP